MSAQLIIRRPSKGTEHIVDLESFGPSTSLQVGRDSRNDVQIPLPFFSSQHLRLFTDGNHWYAEDLGSTNGTVYRGQRLESGKSVRWEAGEPLVVQDLELLLHYQSTHVTLAHTGSLARRMLIDEANLNATDLAFFEIQNGTQAGKRFSLPDHLESFGFELTSQNMREDENGNFKVLREGDGFTLVTELSLLCNNQPWTSGARIHSGARLHLDSLELLFYDPLEDLLPAPPNPPQTQDVSQVEEKAQTRSEVVESPQKKGISPTEWLALGIAVGAIVIGVTLLVVLFG